jgi:hypothetical protein
MKILMVLTSHDRLGDTGRKTGFRLEEFAAPYYVLKDKGAEIVLASPAGGQPPVDPKSEEPENQTPATTRFKMDNAARAAMAHTTKLSAIAAADYEGLPHPWWVFLKLCCCELAGEGASGHVAGPLRLVRTWLASRF